MVQKTDHLILKFTSWNFVFLGSAQRAKNLTLLAIVFAAGGSLSGSLVLLVKFRMGLLGQFTLTDRSNIIDRATTHNLLSSKLYLTNQFAF